MSYILDALRRAEAERERERGAVPNVHAQPALAVDPPASARVRGPVWWGVAAGGVLGAAVVATLWLGGRAALAPPTAATQPQAAAAAPTAPPATLPQGPAATPPPMPAPLAVVSAPEAVPSPPPQRAASAVQRPELPAVAQVAAPTGVAVASRVQPWADLSAEQRREWPALAVGGSIYSENASSRFVMINGQVVREGEAAAPGVTVERIGPKSAVLRWKDKRVELPF